MSERTANIEATSRTAQVAASARQASVVAATGRAEVSAERQAAEVQVQASAITRIELVEVPVEVPGTGAPVVNFPAIVRAGLRFGARLIVRGPLKVLGIAVTRTRALLTPRLRLGVSVINRCQGSLAKPQATVGLSIAAKAAGAPAKPLAAAGVRLVKTRIDLLRTTYGQGAAGYTVGADNDFANVANFNGPDALEADLSGGKGVGGLTEKAGGLETSFAAPVGKDALSLTGVSLAIYVRQTGTLLANGNLRIGYRLGAGPRVQLAAYTGDVDGLMSFDIANAVSSSWAQIGTLSVWVEGRSAALGRSCFARLAVLQATAFTEQ